MTQVEVDYALGNKNGSFLSYPDGHPRAGKAAYDRYVEVEIPAGEYVYMGYVGKQTDRYLGGGTQIWIADDVRDKMDWANAEAAAELLPQF